MSDHICRPWREALGSQSGGRGVGRRLLRLWLCAKPVSNSEVSALSTAAVVMLLHTAFISM